MAINTVIFDVDGLLIDSEPLWQKAAQIVFKNYGFQLTTESYEQTTGLRTKEFVEYWFRQYDIPFDQVQKAGDKILAEVMNLISKQGRIMPGVNYIVHFFEQKGFKIGVASSSPLELIELVLTMANIKNQIQVVTSAEHLPFGKPHPQVYIDCAEALHANPLECLCFEDSFNGLIAAKAAKMKCVVVPSLHQLNDAKWGAADLKLSSLQNFGELIYKSVL